MLGKTFFDTPGRHHIGRGAGASDVFFQAPWFLSVLKNWLNLGELMNGSPSRLLFEWFFRKDYCFSKGLLSKNPGECHFLVFNFQEESMLELYNNRAPEKPCWIRGLISHQNLMPRYPSKVIGLEGFSTKLQLQGFIFFSIFFPASQANPSWAHLRLKLSFFPWWSEMAWPTLVLHQSCLYRTIWFWGL